MAEDKCRMTALSTGCPVTAGVSENMRFLKCRSCILAMFLPSPTLTILFFVLPMGDAMLAFFVAGSIHVGALDYCRWTHIYIAKLLCLSDYS